MAVADMKSLLSDRMGAPDSIRREHTIGAFIAHTTGGFVEACWGEPATGTWTHHVLASPGHRRIK